MPIQTRVEDHTIHITGYVSSDAYEPLKEALSQVSGDKVVLSFDEKCFINSTGLAVLMDLLLPIKDKQISLVHPKAHFRKVFDTVGLSRDVEVLESVPI
jgi:anti-anti-sigma regulatory factor